MSPTTTSSRASVLVPTEAYADLLRLKADFDTVMESIELAHRAGQRPGGDGLLAEG